MSTQRPDFMDSACFYIDDDGWHLKEDAPEDVKKEFYAYMQSQKDRNE